MDSGYTETRVASSETKADSSSSCCSLNRHLCDLRIISTSIKNTDSHEVEMLEASTVAYYLQVNLEKVCEEGQVPEFFKAEQKRGSQAPASFFFSVVCFSFFFNIQT